MIVTPPSSPRCGRHTTPLEGTVSPRYAWFTGSAFASGSHAIVQKCFHNVDGFLLPYAIAATLLAIDRKAIVYAVRKCSTIGPTTSSRST
jgi:hypothetical protein